MDARADLRLVHTRRLAPSVCSALWLRERQPPTAAMKHSLRDGSCCCLSAQHLTLFAAAIVPPPRLSSDGAERPRDATPVGQVEEGRTRRHPMGELPVRPFRPNRGP